MNKIIMLLESGKIISKDETRITESDIYSSKYFMISCNRDTEPHKNFIIIKPSKYLLFSKAVIDYQLTMLYDDPECIVDGISEIQPVHIETKSITKLFCLLNSIDKINIVNNLLMTELCDINTNIGLTYMGITLYDNSNSEIYSEYYEWKDSSSMLYSSYKVAHKFHKLYDADITSFINPNKYQYLYFYQDDCLKWCITDTLNINYELIGIPLRVSNTISMLNEFEYDNLCKYSKLVLYFTVYSDKKDSISEMSEAIANGASMMEISDRLNLVDYPPEIFIDNKRVLYTTSKTRDYLLDFVTTAIFAFDCTNLLFNESYGTFDDNYEFDSILTIQLYESSYIKSCKEFSMNINSLISISDVLLNI